MNGKNELSNHDDGGPAFPRTVPDRNQPGYDSPLLQAEHEGMFLRDWFAGMAMLGDQLNPSLDRTYDEDACSAYRMADAMLVERRKRDEQTR